MRNTKMKKHIITYGTFLGAILCALVCFAYAFVGSYRTFCFDDMTDIPHNTVGVLLGTAPKLPDGRNNLFFIYRIDAAVALYENDKVDIFLISGDNHTTQYNEPLAMKNALMAHDIPEDKIVLDYAGFRTLDSMVRAHKVFGQDTFTVISQPFHNERAVCIARAHGLNVIGANARDVPFARSMRVRIREVGARVKVLLDLFVFHTQPKFLGEPITITQYH